MLASANFILQALLIVRIWRGGIATFPFFWAWLALNWLASPLYYARWFTAWFWFQPLVALLLLFAVLECFYQRTRMVKDLAPVNTAECLDLAVASIAFGSVLVLLVSLRPIQFNLPGALMRIVLFTQLWSAAFLILPSLYLEFRPAPGAPRSSMHMWLFACLLWAQSLANLVSWHKGEWQQWEMVQQVQFSIRLLVMAGWFTLFRIRSANRATIPVRVAPTA